MKATTLLERQHRDLCQLCEAVERGSASMRASLIPQLAGDLVAHMAIEAQLFYPAAARSLHDEGWVRESHGRHRQTREALDRVLQTRLDSEAFGRAIAELRALVEHHAEKEEESLFPMVDRAIDDSAMRSLTHAMMALYHVKVELGYAGTRPVAAVEAYGEASSA